MNRRGVGSLGCVVYLVVVAAAAYVGSIYLNAYLRYYRLKDAMQQEARFSEQRSDVQIQTRLRAFADSIGLPEEASRVEIRRTPERVMIDGNYVDTVQIRYLGTRRIHFQPEVEAHF